MQAQTRNRARSVRTVRTESARHRVAQSRCKLDSSAGLIAPANFLRLPSLKGVQPEYAVRRGMDLARQPLEVLIDQGYVKDMHIDGAKDIVEVMVRSINDLLMSCKCEDEFDIHIELSKEQGERFTEAVPYLCFSWTNGGGEYVALDVVNRRLGTIRKRESLMATFYWLLYNATYPVMTSFSLGEALGEYEMHLEYLKDEQENEDEPLVNEMADPSECPDYIKNANKLKLSVCHAKTAFEAIKNKECRELFMTCLEAYQLSKTIKLQESAPELENSLREARYNDTSMQIGIGIGVDRCDGITAWIDEFAQQYNSGCDPAPVIVRGYLPDDYQAFAQLFKTLPKMVKLTDLLGKCVNTIQEWENETGS